MFLFPPPPLYLCSVPFICSYSLQARLATSAVIHPFHAHRPRKCHRDAPRPHPRLPDFFLVYSPPGSKQSSILEPASQQASQLTHLPTTKRPAPQPASHRISSDGEQSVTNDVRRRSMARSAVADFAILGRLGSGTFGTVFKAAPTPPSPTPRDLMSSVRPLPFSSPFLPPLLGSLRTPSSSPSA